MYGFVGQVQFVHPYTYICIYIYADVCMCTCLMYEPMYIRIIPMSTVLSLAGATPARRL